MAELRNGASPTSSQIIIYYAQKMYAYGPGPWSLKYYLVPKAQKVLVFRVLSTLKKH